jgi:excisionase family DNA binding protein
MTLDDLGSRLFVSTVEAAELLGCDPRTIRAMARRDDIPSVREGSRIKIPVSWLREHAGDAPLPESGPQVDLDRFADRVADLVLLKLGHLFGMAAQTAAADPGDAGPAALADDPLRATEPSHGHRTPAA